MVARLHRLDGQAMSRTRLAPCTECRLPMILQRHGPIPAGYTRQHGGGGLCGRCYSRGWKQAKRAGVPWRPVDEVAVQRAVWGDAPASLSPAERRAAVAVLTRRGLTVVATATVLRTTTRTVERHRARLRRTA
jgi:hypothetical protein